MLITSNDLKERIIGDLKQDLHSKQHALDDLTQKLEETQKELAFFKLALGPDTTALLKRKYKEYRNET